MCQVNLASGYSGPKNGFSYWKWKCIYRSKSYLLQTRIFNLIFEKKYESNSAGLQTEQEFVTYNSIVQRIAFDSDNGYIEM